MVTFAGRDGVPPPYCCASMSTSVQAGCCRSRRRRPWYAGRDNAPMLGDARIIAFVATADAPAATVFYRDVLGLTFVSDESPALVFDAGGTMLRIQKVKTFTPQPFTAIGWRVANITAAVGALVAKGIRLVRYDFLDQDER